MGSMMKHVLLTLNMSEEHFLRLEVINPREACLQRTAASVGPWGAGRGTGGDHLQQQRRRAAHDPQGSLHSLPQGGGELLD